MGTISLQYQHSLRHHVKLSAAAARGRDPRRLCGARRYYAKKLNNRGLNPPPASSES